MTRRVRENFTPKPFYHIGTPPEEFPEVFPLALEEEGEGGDDIPILYTRMVKETEQKEEEKTGESLEDLEPITNPFYGELPSPGFTDSEGEVEEAEDFGLCKGCGTRLELTCTRPSRSEPC